MINVSIQFTEESIPEVAASALNIDVLFSQLTVGGAGGLQLAYFITNGASSQIITSIIGKTFKAVSIDGTFLRKQDPNKEWSYVKSMGQINYTNTLPSGLEGIVFYTNQ